MSSMCQSIEHQSFGLSSNNGAHVLKSESPTNLTNVTAAETHDMSWQRFNSLTLDELSEELDRRTKETQRLQEEVENATKDALERFGCTYDISSSPGQRCHNRCNVSDDPPLDFTVLPTHQQALTQPGVCGQNSLIQVVPKSEVSPPGKGTSDNVMTDCQQQLNKSQDQPEQETFNFDIAIVNLQTKLHKVQMEKNVQSDLRLKDSRKHVDQMEKMLCMLEEVQNIKRAVDQKLQETENEALALNRKVETLEQVIKEIYSSLLSDGKRCENNSITSLNIATASAQISPAENFNNETDRQRGRVFSVEDLGSKECSGINEQKERMEDLITSLGQEMALLTDKLSSSQNNSINLSVKLELLKELSEKQKSLHQYQVRELQSALSCHKDEICCLEQQLIQAQTQLLDAQREKERSLQQAEELRSQISQLKQCDEQQHCELQMEVNVLRGRLEVTREQLRREEEEKICLQALLEQRVQEGRKSHELLREKHEELLFRQEENQQHLSRLDEAHGQCQTLHAEGETLRVKLEDREKMINILRLQMESSIQMLEQHRSSIDNLQQENSLLSNQLNQHKLEIQQLRAETDVDKSNLAAAGHEKQQLCASVAEQRQRVQEETRARQKLAAQLEVKSMKLLTLTKEHKELQQLHSCKKEEQEGVVLELQSQLRTARDELDQVRTTLRILEGADGHGLQVAMDMQKEITVRREQVDSLQGKIQHLQESVEKLYKEKRCQNLENQQHLQQLTFIREEKRQLANELKALRSKDQQLRERIGELEAILHKMSQRFADCQEFIQLQEQEFFRLKLQHTLDLKELQGKNSALHEPPPVLDSQTPSAVTPPPSSQHASNTKSKRQQENSAQELRPLVRDLQGVISQNHRPHTDNSTADSTFYRRRSAPERVHSTAFSPDNAKDVQADSRLRRKTCGSQPHLLTAAERNGNTIKKSFSETPAARYTCSSQLLSPGRRSPVHALLTSDPNTDVP